MGCTPSSNRDEHPAPCATKPDLPTLDELSAAVNHVADTCCHGCGSGISATRDAAAQLVPPLWSPPQDIPAAKHTAQRTHTTTVGADEHSAAHTMRILVKTLTGMACVVVLHTVAGSKTGLRLPSP